MRDEVLAELRQVMNEAGDSYRGGEVIEEDPKTALRWCRFARDYILDRWYRFEPFGVASRDDLIGIVVTVVWEAAENIHPSWGAKTKTFSTSVSIAGTKLATPAAPRR